MNRKEYQNAFSQLEPSKELIDEVLTTPERCSVRHKGMRLSNVLLAAALAVAVLAGTVFAAVQFRWFTLGGAESIVQPRHDEEAAGKDEVLLAAPQNLVKLDGSASTTYIGFTLPESYLQGQDTLNCWRLGNGLYRRYYRNPDPSDPTSPLLTAEIVYDANYLLRYTSEVVKEETLNGMQTVWLRLDSSADGRPQYCLFQRNDALGCFAVVASTESFAEAEQLALAMCYEDSGIPMVQTGDEIRYGFRLGATPEGMTPDSSTAMSDRWYLANATLRDESLNLGEILLSCSWTSSEEERRCNISITVKEGLTEIAPIEYGSVYKTGTIAGYKARWINGSDGSVYVQILFREQQVQLIASVCCIELNPETGSYEPAPAEERFIELAEQLLESAELIPVAIAEAAPAEFYPFSVG